MTEEPHKPARMTLSQVVERLTEPRKQAATSSITLKMSAQGVFMPEVTIAADTTDEQVDTMIAQAVRAFTQAVEQAYQGKPAAAAEQSATRARVRSAR